MHIIWKSFWQLHSSRAGFPPILTLNYTMQILQVQSNKQLLNCLQLFLKLTFFCRKCRKLRTGIHQSGYDVLLNCPCYQWDWLTVSAGRETAHAVWACSYMQQTLPWEMAQTKCRVNMASNQIIKSLITSNIFTTLYLSGASCQHKTRGRSFVEMMLKRASG